MKDEGLGLAGWLLADLVLVLAIIFLAIVPGDPKAEPYTAPAWGDLVLPEMRRDAFFNGALAVRGNPMPALTTVGTLPPGIILDGTRQVLSGTPTKVGDYSFTIRASNRQGVSDQSVSVRVRPPVSECSTVADFAFDQIVIPSVTVAGVTADLIANGRVRVGLSKEAELTVLGEGMLSDLPRAEDYLLQRQRDGFQIALVETFGGQENTTLAQAVNDELDRWLRSRFPGGDELRPLLRDFETEGRERWSANYLARNPELRNSARINIYFVQALPRECI